MPYSQSPTDYLLGGLQILSVICRKGYDFRILKESRLAINRETEKLADGGYQGIDKVYPNSVSPVSEAGTSPYLMPSVGSMKRYLGAE